MIWYRSFWRPSSSSIRWVSLGRRLIRRRWWGGGIWLVASMLILGIRMRRRCCWLWLRSSLVVIFRLISTKRIIPLSSRKLKKFNDNPIILPTKSQSTNQPNKTTLNPNSTQAKQATVASSTSNPNHHPAKPSPTHPHLNRNKISQKQVNQPPQSSHH